MLFIHYVVIFMKKVTKYSLFTVFFVSILAYLLFPFLIEKYVKHSFSQKDWNIQEIRISHPGLTRSHLIRLKLEHKNYGQFEINNAKLRYSLLSLNSFKVDIDRIIFIPALDDQKHRSRNSKIESLNLSNFLPSKHLPQLPEINIRINHIDSPLFSSFTINESIENIHILLNSLQAELSVEAQLQAGDIVKSIFLVNTHNIASMSVIDQHSNKPLLMAEASIAEKPGSISITTATKFDVGDLIQFTSEKTNLPVFIPTKNSINGGQTHIAIATELPSNIEDILQANLLGSIEIKLDKITYITQQYGLESDLNVNFSYKLNNGDLELKLEPGNLENSIVSINRIQTGQSDPIINHLKIPEPIEINLPNITHANEKAIPEIIVSHPILLEFSQNEKSLATFNINNVVAENFSLKPFNLSRVLFEVSSRISLAQTNYAFNLSKLDFQDAILNSEKKISVSNNNLAISFPNPIQIDGQQLKLQDFIIVQPQIAIETSTIKLNLKEPRDLIDTPLAANINIQTQSLSHTATKVSGLNLEAQLELKEKKLTLNASQSGLSLHTNDAQVIKVPPLNYAVAMPFNNKISGLKSVGFDSIAIELRNQCDELLAAGRYSNNEEEQNFSASIERYFNPEATLRQWLNDRTLPIDFTGGRLTADIEWSQLKQQTGEQKRPKINLTLDGVNGIAPGASFEGVQLQLISPELKSSKQDWLFGITSSIFSVNTGTMLTDVSFNGRVIGTEKSWLIDTELFEGELWGGRLSIKDQKIDLSSDSPVNIELDSLSLSKAVEELKVDGLFTTGFVSGTLPMTISDTAVLLEKGELSAPAGGIIKYESDLSQSEDLDPQLKLTLDVLKNFEYEVLKSEASFNGEVLQLKSSIRGRNPEFYDGHEVNLNHNANIDFPPILQAMRIRSGLETQIQEFFAKKTAQDLHKPFCQR